MKNYWFSYIAIAIPVRFMYNFVLKDLNFIDTVMVKRVMVGSSDDSILLNL